MFSAAGKSAQEIITTPTYIEDVFSSYVYTGNGLTQTINNGLSLGSFPVEYQDSIIGNNFNINVSTQSGDWIVVFLSNPTAPTCSVNGVSLTASSIGTVDSALVRVFIQQTTTSITNISTSSVEIGSLTILRGPTSVTIGRGVTSALGSSLTIPTIATTGYGLLLLMDNDVTAPTINVDNGSFAVYNSAVSTMAVFGIDGDGTNTLSRIVSDLNANNRTGYAVLSCTGSGTTVANSAPESNGGMVWMKGRTGTAADHSLYDTSRGATFDLASNLSIAQQTLPTGLLSFNAGGFSIGSLAKINTAATNYISWSFIKKEKFFDVVTYTGTGTVTTIPHNLKSVPGWIVIKKIGATGAWATYHKSIGNTAYIQLSSNAGSSVNNTYWDNTSPTETEFTVGTNTVVNQSGQQFVAYLFADNAGGFGASNSENVISCNSYVGNGSTTGPIIDLGYEPQWILIKQLGLSNWAILDIVRGLNMQSGDESLSPNSTSIGTVSQYINPTATGFQIATTNALFNTSGSTYIYMAIRRGPMRIPTNPRTVFNPIARTGTGANATVSLGSNISDLAITKNRATGSTNWVWVPRLLYTSYMSTVNNNAEVAAAATILQANPWDVMSGIKVGTTSNLTNASANTFVNYLFSRAPAVFDVVCDTGTASAHSVNHNLTVVPELIIRKKRNSATNSDWVVWHTLFSGTGNYLTLNTTDAVATNSTFFPSNPTSTVFNVGTGSRVNNLNDTYVTYLFATLTGVSKVGSYTGTGAAQVINCGFTAGCRFLMVKRVDLINNWIVYDSARGIVSGTEPYSLFNTAAAEVTGTDYIIPNNSGFELSSTAIAGLNANGGTFIYLAFA